MSISIATSCVTFTLTEGAPTTLTAINADWVLNNGMTYSTNSYSIDNDWPTQAALTLAQSTGSFTPFYCIPPLIIVQNTPIPDDTYTIKAS